MEFQILTAMQNFNVLKALLCPTAQYSTVSVIDYNERYPIQEILYSDLNTAITLYFANMPDSDVTFNLPTDYYLAQLIVAPQIGSNRSWYVNMGSATSLTITSENGSPVVLRAPGFGTLTIQVVDVNPVVFNLLLSTDSGASGTGSTGLTGMTGATGYTGYTGYTGALVCERITFASRNCVAPRGPERSTYF